MFGVEHFTCVAGLVLVLGVALPVQANPFDRYSSSYEPKDHKSYGKCDTVTGVDPSTGHEGHQVTCGHTTWRTIAYIVIYFFDHSYNGQPFVRLRASTSLDPPPLPMGEIRVVLRIDDGTLHIHSPQQDRQDAKSVYIYNSTLAMSLLNDLARGQYLDILVGNEAGTIPLGGAREAIADFRQRTGLSDQR